MIDKDTFSVPSEVSSVYPGAIWCERNAKDCSIQTFSRLGNAKTVPSKWVCSNSEDLKHSVCFALSEPDIISTRTVFLSLYQTLKQNIGALGF